MCSIFCLTDKAVSPDVAKKAFDATLSRGPDMSEFRETDDGYVGFHRLAIMGLDFHGMQPFTYKNNFVMCNGELYGFRKEKELLEQEGYKFVSR